jgi:hypothetical protein
MRFVCPCGWSSPSLVLLMEHQLSCNQNRQGDIPMNGITAYCTKCKSTRPMDKAEKTKTKTGRPAHKGVCGVCGHKVFRLGGK